MFDPKKRKFNELTDDKLTDRIGDLHKRMRFFVQKGNIQAIQSAIKCNVTRCKC